MRLIIVPSLLLAACSPSATTPADTGLKEELYFAADGRGRLCVFPGGRDAAIIAFARDSQNNCSAAGRIEGVGDKLALVPAGDSECRIPLQVLGDLVTVGKPGATCDYYCGPDATWGGQVYRWSDTSTADTVAEPLMPSERC